MREQLFEDGVDMPNVHESISLGSLVDAQQTRESLEGKHVCPYCGAVNESPTGPCPNCSLENTPAGRKATKTRIGPWYVLQRRNPAAPGMKYEMLLNFVRKGRVKPRTVVRGPTTYQLWRFAAHVKGLSREFGLCYSCGGKIDPSCTVCPQCNRLQLPPLNPDALLESGEAESPPGGLAMTAGMMNPPAGNGESAEREAIEPPAPPELETNHDIVMPALTDLPAQPAAVASAAESAETVAPPAPAPVDAETLAVASVETATTSLATVGMPAIGEPLVGARARSAALKAGMPMGGLGGQGGPRIVTLGPTGISPAPVLTPSPAPVSRYGQRGRWRGAAEIVLFLAVLIGGVGAAVLMADPSLRDEAGATYNRVLKAMHLKSDSDEPMPEAPMPSSPPALPTVSPQWVPPAPPLQSSSAIPKPAAPLPAPQPTAQPAAHTESAAPAAHPAPPAPAGTDADDDAGVSDQDRAEALYQAALVAEGRSDWATAVKDYREILKFPQSVQRTDVRVRLKNDEAILQSQSASH